MWRLKKEKQDYQIKLRGKQRFEIINRNNGIGRLEK